MTRLFFFAIFALSGQPEPPAIIYLGGSDSSYLFQVETGVVTGYDYQLTIRDHESHTVLYEQAFSDGVHLQQLSISKKYATLDWDVKLLNKQSHKLVKHFHQRTDVSSASQLSARKLP